MSAFKHPKIGRYQSKDRALQKRMSYEKVSLTWKSANVYRYLGDRTLGTGSSINDIQDDLFLENTDRRYDATPVLINISMEDQQEQPFDLGKFGIIPIIGDTQIFRVHVNSFEADGMGRYIVVGDVLEIPFLQTEGNAGKKAFFEVTDTDRKMEFENFYVTITTVPIKDSQEFADIDGIPTNSDVLDTLQDSLDASYEATFKETNVAPEPSLFTDREFVDDEFWDATDTDTYTDEGNREPYPKHDEDDWLNGEVF